MAQTLTPPPPPTLPGNQTPNKPRAGFLQPNTLLGRFQLMAAAATFLSILALIGCYFALDNTAKNFRELVTKITPSLDSSQTLGQALEDMDASAADYQLTSRIDVTSPDFSPKVYGDDGFRLTAWKDLENNRVKTDNALLMARNKAGYAGEAESIQRIGYRFPEYYARLNLMKSQLDQGFKEAALANYKAAQDILVGNLGNPERDNLGNNKEKLLKDNNWQETTFVCAVNCVNGSAGKSVTINFNLSDTYEGLAANVHKLTVINQNKLNEIGDISPLYTVLVIVTGGLLVVVMVLISVYYALITHRVINPGFALAFVVSIVLAFLLVSTLNNATQDYKQFSNQYIKAISISSRIQQLSADARADISRLLLSPDSPGLDSTNPALTSDVKKAFGEQTLTGAYEVKKKKVGEELDNLLKVAGNSKELSSVCAASPCSSGAGSWTKFTTEVENIRKKFQSKLLADAILISITPTASTTQSSAREPYQATSKSLTTFADANKKQFDAKACASINDSEFGNSCGGQTGYLNQLQAIIWIAFPVLALLVSGGVWYASREL